MGGGEKIMHPQTFGNMTHPIDLVTVSRDSLSLCLRISPLWLSDIEDVPEKN